MSRMFASVEVREVEWQPYLGSHWERLVTTEEWIEREREREIDREESMLKGRVNVCLAAPQSYTFDRPLGSVGSAAARSVVPSSMSASLAIISTPTAPSK